MTVSFEKTKTALGGFLIAFADKGYRLSLILIKHPKKYYQIKKSCQA